MFALVGQFSTITRYADLVGTSTVVASSSTYDTLGRLTNLVHADGASATLAEYTYTFDAIHRITSVTSLDGTSDYAYDATSQLTTADHTGATLPADEAYTFDANGNRTMSGHTTGANNQLVSDGIFDYEFDAEGNRTAATRVSSAAANDYKIEYTWDHRNRLARVVHKNNSDLVTLTVEFAYDVQNRKIAKRTDADADGVFELLEHWVYDGAHAVLKFTDFDGEDSEPSSLTSRYQFGPQVDQILAEERFVEGLELGDTAADPGDLLLPLTDHIGSVRDLATWDAALSETALVNHIVYDSFGNIVSQTDETVPSTHGLAGREWDADVRLYYNWNRWLDPFTGRFISEDPIGFNAGDANIARYVGNDPTSKIDPSGLAESGFFDEYAIDLRATATMGAQALTQGTPLGHAISAYNNYQQDQARTEQIQGLRDSGYGTGAAIGVSAGNEFGEMLGLGDFVSAWNGQTAANDKLNTSGKIYRYGTGVAKLGMAAAGLRAAIFGPKTSAPPRIRPPQTPSTPEIVKAEFAPEAGSRCRPLPSAERIAADAGKARNYPATSASPGSSAPIPHRTFQPGPSAGESIPARSPAKKFTPAERDAINTIGRSTGCHTCGATSPGTKLGNFVPDHQPPSSLNANNSPQRLYPHCIHCSREQGLALAKLKRINHDQP